MPVRTVGEYLKRWGYTPQRPLHRAYQQKPEVVQHWLDNEYPRIAQRTRAENGEIQWGDETGMRSDRSEEHTSELQSLMRISYAVFCLKKKKKKLITQYAKNIHNKPSKSSQKSKNNMISK